MRDPRLTYPGALVYDYLHDAAFFVRMTCAAGKDVLLLLTRPLR